MESRLVQTLAKFADWLPLIGRLAPAKNLRSAQALLGDALDLDTLGRRMNQSRLTGRYLNTRIRLFGRKHAAPRVRCELSRGFIDARQRKTPTLLVGWHAGQLNCLFTGLLRSAPDAAILKSRLVHADLEQTFTVFGTDESDANKALGNAMQLRRVTSHLRKGGVLLTFLDGTNGSGCLEVPFLHQTVPLRQGVTTLARASGAQVFPCFGRWDSKDQQFLFQIGDAVDLEEIGTSTSESTLRSLTTLADIFAQHLRMHPEDITTETSYLAGKTASELKS